MNWLLDTLLGSGSGHPCALCGRPIRGRYFQHEGRVICEKDYLAKVAPRCFFCGVVLEGTYLVNPMGQHACHRHGHGPTCTSCNRWLGPEERLHPPRFLGSTPCRQCLLSAVDVPQLRSYGNAFGARALRAAGLELKAQPRIPLRLDSAVNIRNLRGAGAKAVEGVTLTIIHTLDGREHSREVQGIVVLGGLAQDHFEAVLAHEFGHVWLFNERLDPGSELLVEGFCELVKYLWLEQLGTPLAKAIQRRTQDNPDPVYGGGFRRVKERWDSGRLGGVMALLGH